MPSSHASTSAEAARHGSGLDVLLVDDNLDARETLAVLIGLNGHRVHQAPGPLPALELAQHTLFDVAVLDIALPGMDGHALAWRLRTLPGCTQCRFIALSGYDIDRERHAESGFEAHFLKPVDPQELLDVIERAAR